MRKLVGKRPVMMNMYIVGSSLDVYKKNGGFVSGCCFLPLQTEGITNKPYAALIPREWRDCVIGISLSNDWMLSDNVVIGDGHE